IRAPQFLLNRQMLLSVFGHSNRYKNLGLMRWLSTKLPKIIQFKKKDLVNYIKHRERYGAPPSHSMVDTDADTETAAMEASLPPSYDFKTLLPLLVKAQVAPSRKIGVDIKNLGKAFDIDINNQTIPEPPPEKTLDLDLHIRILERDVAQISTFAKNLDQ